MNYKSLGITELQTKDIWQFQGSLHLDSLDGNKTDTEKAQLANIKRNPSVYFVHLATALKGNDDITIMNELDRFNKIISKSDFSFDKSFEAADLPNGLFYCLSNRNSRFFTIILKIIVNLSASNYCSAFEKLQPVDVLFSIFKEVPITNIKSYALKALANFVGNSFEFRNSFMKHVSYVTNVAQDSRVDRIIKQNVFLLIMNCSLFQLDEPQYQTIGNAVLSLVDYADDDMLNRIIVIILEKLSKYNIFFQFFKDTQIPFILSKNLSSTDSTLVQSTLLIERLIYFSYEFQNIPEIEKIAKHLHSKSCQVAIAACRVLSEIFKKSPNAVDDDIGVEIAKDLSSFLYEAKISLKKEAFYCLLCLLYIRNDYMREIVDERFVSTLHEFLSIEDDAMISIDLKLLNIIFSVEVNDGQHMPLFYFFCGNQGNEAVEELSHAENREIADLATSFINKFRDYL